ncbi:MAG: hypothetical protein ABIG60_04000 [Patescibacteria group bacterium]
METRQKNLLKIIIKEYIKTAEPISSGLLVRKFKLPYSPATVRHEMVKLEEEGYIHQPHTSAGRVPTEKAYQFYIQNFIYNENSEPRRLQNQTKDFEIGKSNKQSLKQTAKILAAKTGLAVFWAEDEDDLHYTGISNLLSQPEFIETQQAISVSKSIDEIENIIASMFSFINNEPQILIGEENPFNTTCGSVIVKYRHGDHTGMFGIVGPMRMDYEQCLRLINYIIHKL